MNVVFALSTAMVSAAGVLTLLRLVRGPLALDRIIAVDVLVTLILAGAAIGVASRKLTSFLPVLLVLALLAFIGSVTAAHLIEKREGMR
ncbi:sodium:proton antiporter [Streptomyces sp. N2-109]|uniref:Sodium:proton antiporter n=1 Tax=Streptomyces gossypii TaxID=2883101 RepID=A0ABT2JTF9_9ACTN|nr:monovalent cation/H+ antiporter complex subunit F [Streptomyces gossypii]MCT2590973.1 sodium:proton antiporter [Streptomyces gossypii]